MEIMRNIDYIQAPISGVIATLYLTLHSKESRNTRLCNLKELYRPFVNQTKDG